MTPIYPNIKLKIPCPNCNTSLSHIGLVSSQPCNVG